MVAHDPNRPADPSRTLCPESVARLRDAIAAQWRDGSPESEATRDALVALAREARERRIYPETLVVAIKQIEGEVLRAAPMPGAAPRTPVSRRQLTEWLVSTCLRCYYGTGDD